MVVGGGAAVGRVGRLVGKLGSVGDSGLVTGVPPMIDWHPASNAPVASPQATANCAFFDRRTQFPLSAPYFARVRKRDGSDWSDARGLRSR
jgi:hypothetical protein